MSFTIGSLVNTLGLQNSAVGQGAIGYEKEKDKLTNQLYVLGVLFVALVFGIIAVALFSTGVSDLETYGDYFNSTGHKVAIGFAAATLITLIVAGVMLDSSLECAEDTRARATLRSPSPPMPNIIGSVSPYAPQPLYRPPSPRPPTPPGGSYRQPAYAQQPIFRPAPRPPQPPPVRAPPQPQIYYPPVPLASPTTALPAAQAPIEYPTVPTQSPTPIEYPAVPTQSPSLATTLATALPGLVNAAAPIALAAANAPQGQRGLAAFNAATIPQQ